MKKLFFTILIHFILKFYELIDKNIFYILNNLNFQI